jgi:hypothetical protein
MERDLPLIFAMIEPPDKLQEVSLPPQAEFENRSTLGDDVHRLEKRSKAHHHRYLSRCRCESP